MALRLWRKAAAAVKDRRSIYLARVGRKRGFRNPYLEAAIIKATSHDESLVDYKNAQRVFDWVRTSPNFLKPLMWSLTKRVQKTRNWVVALKALMLLHGVFCTRIPAVRKIGRLPFDLTTFQDRSSSPADSLGYSAFVRAYYAFLDHHSTLLTYCHDDDGDEEEEEAKQQQQLLKEETDISIKKRLQRLGRLQALLDLLLQIKPCTDRMEVALVLEALDCVVLEVIDLHSAICSGVMAVLAQVTSTMAVSEAAEALQILQKGASQNSQLKSYLQMCRQMGVVNTTELPPMKQISEDDISDLERIVLGASMDEKGGRDGDIEELDLREISGWNVKENWEVFDERDMGMGCCGASSRVGSKTGSNDFWQPHHQTKQLSLCREGDPFNENRTSGVF